jgi:integrase/recombinase XerD
MTIEVLSRHLDAFLALKQARAKCNPHFSGDHRRRLRYDEGLLRSFLSRWQQHGCPWPIRADFALDWVMAGSSVGRPYRDEHRLFAIRAFLQQVRTLEERTEIPQASFRRRYRRRAPYIFSDQEVVQLMEAASRNRLALRATTVSTLIGLLASTGIRIGEALRLTVDDVRLDATPPHLFICETKFGKSRNVVLHPSTVSHFAPLSEGTRCGVARTPRSAIFHEHPSQVPDL